MIELLEWFSNTIGRCQGTLVYYLVSVESIYGPSSKTYPL
jgi:hypothetical protein